MPKFKFVPEHKGHTFGYGPKRSIRARAGQVIDLDEETAEKVLATIPGQHGQPSLLLRDAAEPNDELDDDEEDEDPETEPEPEPVRKPRRKPRQKPAEG